MAKLNEFDYHGAAAEFMKKNGIEIWAKISTKTSKGIFKGIVIPRGEQGDENHIVIKLPNGYNIGINIIDIEEIKIIEKLTIKYKIPEKTFKKDLKKPTVALLGTGGTVASKLDYVTGAVLPAFTPQELFNAVPELQDICNLETKQLFQILSENIKPEHWIAIANEIANQIETTNPNGIVIAHGTDTLHYTSAALSFMLKNINCPIVLVGSQRSSDRPSSDAAINLINSIHTAAFSDIAEVVVCMHGQSGDSYNLLHRGTRVRKMHTSRRDAFRTIADTPLAKIKNGKIYPTGVNYNKRKVKSIDLETDVLLDKKVGLIYFYPGMNSEIIDFYIDKQYRGLVIAGTGLGHVSQDMLQSITRAKEEGLPIFMTSQCLWGFTGMNVYETGRLLLQEGVIPLANMLPETALVKTMWVLGHTKEIPFVKELMQKNLAGEITQSERFDEYLILQSKIEKGLMKILEKN